MLKEILFLAPCLGLAVAGLWFGRWYWQMSYHPFLGQWTSTQSIGAPVWLIVLSGVLWAT
jgi:hypothetical protein